MPGHEVEVEIRNPNEVYTAMVVLLLAVQLRDGGPAQVLSRYTAYKSS